MTSLRLRCAGVLISAGVAAGLAGCASGGAGPRSSSASSTPAWVTAAIARFTTLATDNGEPHPSSLHWAITTRDRAGEVLFGTTQDSRPDIEVVAIEAEGSFSGQMMKGTLQSLPPSPVLIAVIEHSSGQISDWGLLNASADLSRLVS